MKDKVPPTSSEYTKWLKKTSNLQLTLSDTKLRIPAYKRSSIVSQIPYSLCPSQSELLSFKSSLSDVTIPPEEPPFIPDITYTFTSAGLDTSVWTPNPPQLVDVVSQTSSIYGLLQGPANDVLAPVPGNYMARLKASSMVTPTTLSLPFYAPGQSRVTFVIKFVNFDSAGNPESYNDFAIVLDVVETPSPSTTELFKITTFEAGVYTDSDWLTITKDITTGGNHILKFGVQNVGDESLVHSSELLVYSVRIQRNSE